MISFFLSNESSLFAVEHQTPFSGQEIDRLAWLFGLPQPMQPLPSVEGFYKGPRSEMVSPWSTNAVEIAENMGLSGISRIEELTQVESADAPHDPMLEVVYTNPNEKIFATIRTAEPILFIEDIAAYNKSEGLALSEEEIAFLEQLSQRLGRKLTDSELFGFSQVNSEHCRHKIFNGTFVIDGEEKPNSLFSMIKETSQENPNSLVSAYKDNVAFVQGTRVEQFAPLTADKPDFYTTKPIDTVLSLKAETHNFPTTVEPFNGAATGTGGEIRDRMAGGKASIPVAGTAVYMTSYPRLKGTNSAPSPMGPRNWLYQHPQGILTKASNGASDFGNKFGQPIIAGSLLTFEHQEAADATRYGYDKVIMLAGGIGYARQRDAIKEEPQADQLVVMMGGDNYRIGMGGGAVSSVNTGQYSSGIELNAVQRANPEMQKRVCNVVRALAESEDNPIISIHDHGAGGHLNCLTELIEATGGKIDIDSLPVGDTTLSAKEIIGNESQERMGMLIDEKDYNRIAAIAERERAPIYKVGKTDTSKELVFGLRNGEEAIHLAVDDMLAKPPRTVMSDRTVEHHYEDASYEPNNPLHYLNNVLSLEAVASKDWLTNKVDRSVTGRIARQQCCGALQLPLSDLGAIALDYRGRKGYATSIGHAPQAGLINAANGSILSIAEALTNIVFAPLEEGLESVSLSANWMWPCRNEGEDARLYNAVEACSKFAIDLGINIPTGKDSLSMTQKYPNDKSVVSPGTVIISAAAAVLDVRGIVSPVIKQNKKSHLIYIDFSFAPLSLGGSALFQSLGKLGSEAPTVGNAEYFADAFDSVQKLLRKGVVLAGHDISAGGMITTLLEMCFANVKGGLDIDLSEIPEEDLTKLLYAENPGVILQVKELEVVTKILEEEGIGYALIGHPNEDRVINITKGTQSIKVDIDEARRTWYAPSYRLDCFQSTEKLAKERFDNLGKHPIKNVSSNSAFDGKMEDLGLNPNRQERSGIVAAVLRDKGTNGEREMAYALHLAGFDVKDVHLTDLTSGRETLEDVQMLVFCGGFSNSDVLGSAKGWAAGILFNERAKASIDAFYARPDTLSLGICNGCQLMAELGLIYADKKPRHRMAHNHSHKYESCFVSLTIPENKSVMLSSLAGSKLGVWCAHGEGRFDFEAPISEYNVAARYTYDAYPANPNGSPEGVAALVSDDGRHLAMMPHPERSVFPWQCGYYKQMYHEITPWMEAFKNAYNWLANKKKD